MYSISVIECNFARLTEAQKNKLCVDIWEAYYYQKEHNVPIRVVCTGFKNMTPQYEKLGEETWIETLTEWAREGEG